MLLCLSALTPAAIIAAQLPDFIPEEHTATWEDIDDVLPERAKKPEGEVSSIPKLDIRAEDSDSGGTARIHHPVGARAFLYASRVPF